MKVSRYKYRLLILALGIVSTVSAVGAGLTGNLLFYNSFTSSRYISEGIFSWRVRKKVPLILIGGLFINLVAVLMNIHQLVFMSSATFALNSIVISWKVLGERPKGSK